MANLSSSRSSLIVAANVILSLSYSAGVAHGRRHSRSFIRSYDSPCKQMRLYFHDILYDYSNSTTNSTSAAATKPTALSTATVTPSTALPPSLNVTADSVRAQGLYLYDEKERYNAWFAFSIVFNSTAYGHGTLQLMGADTMSQKTRDISVVGRSIAPSLIVTAAAAVFLISLSSPTLAHGGGQSRRFVRSYDYDSPCKQMKFYFHDILYDYSNSTTNSTSAVVASPASLLSAMNNTSVFGTMMVFNDPMTEGNSLPPSLDETAGVRAQGIYFYNKKQSPADAWFAFSIVFNSTAYGHGTINLMGEDFISEKTRDIAVVGGTGDFFMARGVATIQGDAIEGFTYFRLQVDIKLYECYI
uniref:Dirigent protein n=1 Tax=Leersia perrieri TaxID=77586 RepID=A0A0D9X1Y6_9ORYZ